MAGKLRIAIIGAGVAGMAAAWDLVRAGHQVTLFEGGAEVGGLAAGFRDEGWTWTLEKFYHHWFETDREILKLAEEIGVKDQMVFPRPKTSYWIDGKIYRSEISLSALLLPLSLIAKMRLALSGAFLKFTPDWKSLEKVTADSWMRRFMGEEVYNKLWKPLLIGKFSDRYREVNMAWMWARIKARSLRLGTFQGGFQAFLERLADAITAKGAEICLNSPVERIQTQGDQVAVSVKGSTHLFDRVISTTSPRLMLKLSEDLAATAYGQQMASLESLGGLCVVFALKQSLLTDNTYWLNLPATSPDKNKSQFPFLALVEHTNWMDKAHYNGDVIVYCGDYVPADHEYFKLSEAELTQRFQGTLTRFNPDFKPEWVRKSWVFRAPYAQPLPGVNHSEKIPPLKTPIKGLYWASMSQVYPWDRGTNFAVEIGRKVAQEVLNDANH
ncbi:MAG: NAD(P)/FAD-dependent oxidoreductase [Anaerolineae bacterium]|jgi:protoporphyrinogen oxidase|nr:NAD(P)/FAD-dependent oxidoreductase [Anaerolineae bacterium]